MPNSNGRQVETLVAVFAAFFSFVRASSNVSLLHLQL
jgi:hypothetical protein